MNEIPQIDTKEYVISHIDDAINHGWIKVFYQPVVRAITGQLCSSESLARWIDPEIGFLPPDKFIGVLEEKELIHKLDCYVVERVCQDIRQRLDKNEPVVPVSVNFSRLDFMMCDMLRVVEDNVKKYDVPRDFLHVEITESMIVSDEDMMSEVIRCFRNAGYEIWMDDFGSGYSSLTLLKDYEFDLLKLDMRFLSSFTDKSKSIMRSAITMAKDIGVRTLAEGVETEAQCHYLREIGCGRMQGYFFGRPEPIDDMYNHIKERGIEVEGRKWRHFYDVASLAVRDTDYPLEIVYDDGANFKTLFINKAYRDQINIPYDLPYEALDKIIYQTGSPLLSKYRQFADIIESTGNQEIFYYSAGRNYLRFEGQIIAEYGKHYIIKGSVTDITFDENIKEKERLDSKLRSLNLQYEVVHLLNLKKNIIDPLIGRNRVIKTEKEVYENLAEAIEHFSQNYVFPKEKEAYKEFLDLTSLNDRITYSSCGYIEEAFRIKDVDGNYKWKDIVIVPIPQTGGMEYLYCLKPLLDNTIMISEEDKEQNSIKHHKYSVIFENLLWSCSIKFFWKDKNRRFRGVSQSFLNFYGIKDKADILGKTDEEMKWHIEDEPYRDDELDIIEKGTRVDGVTGQCIVNGVVHNIVCSKMPLYDDGEIVGLIGYFVDAEEEIERVQNLTGPQRIDPVTKLMNARAFIDAMIGYAIQYAKKRKNYGIIVLSNRNHKRILDVYGEEIADKTLTRIAQEIIGVTGQSCAVARNKEAIFGILMYVDKNAALEKLANDVRTAVEQIREVDGNSVTINVDIAYKMRSDVGINDENIYKEALDMLSDNK